MIFASHTTRACRLLVRAGAHLGTSALLCCVAWGCSAASVQRNRNADSPASPSAANVAALRLEQADGNRASTSEPSSDSLGRLVQHALKNSPELAASYEEWRSLSAAVSPTGRLPEPVLSYGVFIRSVETRVGPQRQRIGLTQAFPWPTALKHASKSARLHSQSMKRQYEAMALSLVQRVSDAYWQAWLEQRSVVIETERSALLTQLSGSIQSRVAVGQATLADLAQVNVAITRADDAVSHFEEQYGGALDELRALIGADVDHPIQVPEGAPAVVKVNETDAQLLRAARLHPRVQALAIQANAQLSEAASQESELYPAFRVGVDYIQTDEGPTDSADNGKDPLLVMLSVKLPLWAHIYGTRGEEKRAMSRSMQARVRAEELRSRAATLKLLSRLRDSARRTRLLEASLLPQANAMYGSVLGSYQAGRSGIAQTLLASEQLLTMQAQLFEAQAQHAQSLAQLQSIVGRAVEVKVLE